MGNKSSSGKSGGGRSFRNSFRSSMKASSTKKKDKQGATLTETRAGGSLEDLKEVYAVNWTKSGALGKGHYATVYKGKNRVSGLPVAVKKISRALARPETLRLEVAALLKVRQHESIVELFDVFVSEEHVFLVMELLAGGELFDRIVKSGAYSEQDASRHLAS